MNRALKLSLAATLLTAGSAAADVLTRPGYFSVEVEGWQHQPEEGRVIFACTDCGSPVQVQIDYGPELPATAEYKTNEQFLARLQDEDAQREFASLLINSSLPDQLELEVEVQKVGFSEVGGLKVFEYSALLGTTPEPTRDSGIVALQNNRLMKLTLNHYDSALTPKVAERIRDFLKSLKFLK